MITRLDHLVILVHDIDRAMTDYEKLGFEVTPGGEHADGLTRNALIPFRDGSYLELVAFLDPSDVRDNFWGWRPYLEAGGGLIDYCAASDDLDREVDRIRARSFTVEGPDEGGRRLPSGEEIRWKNARVHQSGRVLPFLIEDLTPRETRVPGGSATEHPNGSTGVSRLNISASDSEQTAELYKAFIGDTSHQRSREASVQLGDCEISIPIPDVEMEHHLDSIGPGPFSIELGGRDLEAVETDRTLTHGVRMRLG